MLEFTLCNELLAADGLSLAEQAETAAALGYVGLELAPTTLGAAPHRMDPTRVDDIRKTVEAAGVRVTGLHWLLSGYPEASITDRNRWDETQHILIDLISVCAGLGGKVLVHGSPGQRTRPDWMSDDQLISHLAEFFQPIATAAESMDVVYCIEPLAQAETRTITTVSGGAELVKAVGSPAFLTMIDCKAAGVQEPPVADCIRSWVPRGVVGHIHANDTNLGAPGMGEDPFPEIIAALHDVGWNGLVGIEPFRNLIDGRVTAATGIATLRACERALS